MQINVQAALSFDRSGINLLGRLSPAAPQRPNSEFKPDTFPVQTFAAKDIIGPVKVTSSVVNGENEEIGRVIADLNLALVGADFQLLKNLASSVQRSSSIGNVASFEYLVDQIWEWVERSARCGVQTALAAHLEERLSRDVSEHEFWFPLHRVHSEIELQMGPVEFKTLDSAMMQRWQDSSLACVADEQRERATEYYRRLRSKMQGSLAAVVHVTGEPKKASSDGRDIAQMAVSMLRFVSPANFSPRTRSYCTLLGEEAITATHSLEIKDGDLACDTRGTPAEGPHAWCIRKEDLRLLPPGLLQLLSELSSNRKSAYPKQLYDSLLIYSRNSIASEVSDKLLFILVALESMLLRDENEPIQKNIGERMALIAGQTVEERKAIVANLTKVYSLRSKFVHHGQSAADIEPLYPFMVNAWTCFCNLLGWQNRFANRSDLISWLESRKLSG